MRRGANFLFPSSSRNIAGIRKSAVSLLRTAITNMKWNNMGGGGSFDQQSRAENEKQYCWNVIDVVGRAEKNVVPDHWYKHQGSCQGRSVLREKLRTAEEIGVGVKKKHCDYGYVDESGCCCRYSRGVDQPDKHGGYHPCQGVTAPALEVDPLSDHFLEVHVHGHGKKGNERYRKDKIRQKLPGSRLHVRPSTIAELNVRKII